MFDVLLIGVDLLSSDPNIDDCFLFLAGRSEENNNPLEQKKQ